MAIGHLINLEKAIKRAEKRKTGIKKIKGDNFLLIEIDTFYCGDRQALVYGSKEKSICLEKDECEFKYVCIYEK